MILELNVAITMTVVSSQMLSIRVAMILIECIVSIARIKYIYSEDENTRICLTKRENVKSRVMHESYFVYDIRLLAYAYLIEKLV